jgi:two-component system copper resistance phosphate regulon response regulator CusR
MDCVHFIQSSNCRVSCEDSCILLQKYRHLDWLQGRLTKVNLAVISLNQLEPDTLEVGFDMKVLVVEDDPEISAALRVGLEKAGFVVDIIRDGERALRVALTRAADVIVLDLMLPTMDGVSLCKQLRGAQIPTPILMLTAKGSLEDRVVGLESGADDYLVKPFEFAELLARVRALVRRDKVNRSSRIEIADLVIDTSAHVVTRAGKEILLTKREYQLLEALALRQGQVLSRDTIHQAVWNDEFSTSNTIDVHVRRLRQKIDDESEHKLIHTIIRVGYVLRSDGPEFDSNG